MRLSPFFLRSVRALLPGVAFILGGRAAATAAAEAPPDYVSRNWMVDEGLPHNTVNQVVQDDRGYLWLASGAGLARFDGVSFRDYALAEGGLESAGNLRDLAAAGPGRLLLLPASGGLWELAGGRMRRHPMTAKFTGQTLLDLYVEPGGVIWVGAEPAQVMRWEDGRMQVWGADAGLEKRASRITFARDGAGYTWVACGDFLGQYRDGRLGRVDTGFDPQGAGFVIATRRGGGVWISSSDRLMTWENGRLTTLCREPEWPAHQSGVACLFEDRRGGLWVGSRRSGVFLFAQGAVNRIATPARTIQSITEDGDGNIWLGTVTEGVMRLRPQPYTLLDADAGLADPLSSSICEDASGVIWCANRSGGLVRYRDGRIEKVKTNTPLDLYTTRVSPDRAGGLWAAADTGLYRFPENAPEKIRATEPSLEGVQILFASRAGDMWVANATELGYFRGGAYHPVPLPAGTTRARFNAIEEDSRGHIWIGANRTRSATSEVHLWEYAAGKLQERLAPGAWPAGPILSLRIDARDRLWFGTTAGLVMRDGDRMVRLSTANGLPDDNIAQQLEDAEGRVWMGSRRGFFHVSQEALLAAVANPADRVLPTVFGTDDGLRGATSLNLGQPRSWRGRGGRLWFTTHRGIVGFDPAALAPAGSQPKVYIESVTCDGRVHAVEDGPVKVEPETRRIVFHFAVLNYSAPEQIQVRHRVDHFDLGWVEAQNERTAVYSRLPPGEYRLRVMAANEAGQWSRPEATLNFLVEAAWWQTTAFRLAAMLGVTGLIAWGVRTWSVRKIRRQLAELEKQHALERERARIARNLHDELGGSLTQIGLLAERVKRQGPRESEGLLHQLAWRTRTLVGDLESIVWTISPQNNSWDRLASFVAQFARRFFKDTPVVCVVTGVDEIPGWPLEPDVQHEVLAVLKETANNILKHARAQRVTVSLRMAEGAFTLRLADDGVGFDPTAREHSERNGLSNLRVRGEAVGGETAIVSRPGAGTTVTLRVPVKPPREGQVTATEK